MDGVFGDIVLVAFWLLALAAIIGGIIYLFKKIFRFFKKIGVFWSIVIIGLICTCEILVWYTIDSMAENMSTEGFVFGEILVHGGLFLLFWTLSHPYTGETEEERRERNRSWEDYYY